MVWRKIIGMAALCLLLVPTGSAQASAPSVYLIDNDTMTFYQYEEVGGEASTFAVGDGSVYDGTISTTYLTIFKDTLSQVGINEDYVFYRSGQYEYAMIAGDLEFDGSVIRLVGSGRSYVLTYQSNYGQDNYYHWEVSDISSFRLNTGDYLVYSNLGDFPTLEGRESVYAFGTLLCVAVIGVCSVIRALFGFVSRNR